MRAKKSTNNLYSLHLLLSRFPVVNWPDQLERNTRETPDKARRIYNDGKITYSELNAAANRFARALVKMGTKNGDRVALLIPNMPQFVMAAYGVWKIGAAIVPQFLKEPIFLPYVYLQVGHTNVNNIKTLSYVMQCLSDEDRLRNVCISHTGGHLFNN